MSKIEWTQQTMNCITGCTPISTGCTHCYSKRMTHRLQKMGQEKYAGGFDNVVIHPTAWQEVKKWKKPCKVFLNSMSDTFHEDVPWWYIRWMFEMMNHYDKHIWQVLTKRAAMMEQICNHPLNNIDLTPNIWMGVTVENQENIHRIEHLKAIDAKVKFVSFGPLLGPIDLSEVIKYSPSEYNIYELAKSCDVPVGMGIGPPILPFHWAIIEAESGPGARPMEEEWVRDLIRQLSSAGVKIFYKQRMEGRRKISLPEIDGRQWIEYPDGR